MASSKVVLEKRRCALVAALDRNLQKKSNIENVMHRQEEDLRQTEALLEKLELTPLYLTRR